MFLSSGYDDFSFEIADTEKKALMLFFSNDK